MRSFKVIRDPKAMELLGDETRRRMIYLLRGKEMSVNQLAKQLDKTPQAIYHQIKKLTDAGMVEVEREKRSGHLMEAYYRATAEVFNFMHGETGSHKLDEKMIKPVLESLAKLGLADHADDETVAEVARVQRQLFSLGEDENLEQRIEKLDDIDSLHKQAVLEYSKIMSMTDDQFRTYLTLYSRIRDLLKSRSKIQKTQLVQTPPRA